jgi:hypothetical protein
MRHAVQNVVAASTVTTESQKQKSLLFLNSRLSLLYLGWLMGLEPTTTGITILTIKYFTPLIHVATINTNQQLTRYPLDT